MLNEEDFDRQPPNFSDRQLTWASDVLAPVIEGVSSPTLRAACEAVLGDAERLFHLAHQLEAYRLVEGRPPLMRADVKRLADCLVELEQTLREVAPLANRMEWAAGHSELVGGDRCLGAAARRVACAIREMETAGQDLALLGQQLLRDAPAGDRLGPERALTGGPRKSFAAAAALFWWDAGLNPSSSRSGFPDFIASAIKLVEGKELRRSALAAVVSEAAGATSTCVRSR